VLSKPFGKRYIYRHGCTYHILQVFFGFFIYKRTNHKVARRSASRAACFALRSISSHTVRRRQSPSGDMLQLRRGCRFRSPFSAECDRHTDRIALPAVHRETDRCPGGLQAFRQRQHAQQTAHPRRRQRLPLQDTEYPHQRQKPADNTRAKTG